jgi:hypothetical protein
MLSDDPALQAETPLAEVPFKALLKQGRLLTGEEETVEEAVEETTEQIPTTPITACNVPTGCLSDLDAKGCLSGSTTTKCITS